MAECSPCNAVPKLVQPDMWTRTRVFQWVQQEANKAGARMLLGLDFAFALPYCDEGAYFPGCEDSPANLNALWSKTDEICSSAPDFYGGPFYREASAPFQDYLWYPRHKGSEYQPRLRLTEKACKDQVTTPTSCFKLLGANQVGSGSIAGMRFLHALTDLRRKRKIAIWPFDDNVGTSLTIVEIFPRLCQKLGFIIENPNEHSRDALSSAAALRSWCDDFDLWQPLAMSDTAKKYEGWIFGVTGPRRIGGIS
jgi:hypothetical protein